MAEDDRDKSGGPAQNAAGGSRRAESFEELRRIIEETRSWMGGSTATDGGGDDDRGTTASARKEEGWLPIETFIGVVHASIAKAQDNLSRVKTRGGHLVLKELGFEIPAELFVDPDDAETYLRFPSYARTADQNFRDAHLSSLRFGLTYIPVRRPAGAVAREQASEAQPPAGASAAHDAPAPPVSPPEAGQPRTPGQTSGPPPTGGPAAPFTLGTRLPPADESEEGP